MRRALCYSLSRYSVVVSSVGTRGQLTRSGLYYTTRSLLNTIIRLLVEFILLRCGPCTRSRSRSRSRSFNRSHSLEAVVPTLALQPEPEPNDPPTTWGSVSRCHPWACQRFWGGSPTCPSAILPDYQDHQPHRRPGVIFRVSVVRSKRNTTTKSRRPNSRKLMSYLAEHLQQ